jgi:hypothetical protein
VLSDEKKITGNVIACQGEKYPRCCVTPGRARGVWHPDRRLGRGSDRRAKKTGLEGLKLDRNRLKSPGILSASNLYRIYGEDTFKLF